MKIQSKLVSFDGSEAEVSWEGGSETIRSNTLIWTAGFTAVNMVQRSVFKTVRGKIAVNDYLEVEGHPGVFAAGDCSLLMDPKRGSPTRPPATWPRRRER